MREKSRFNSGSEVGGCIFNLPNELVPITKQKKQAQARNQGDVRPAEQSEDDNDCAWYIGVSMK